MKKILFIFSCIQVSFGHGDTWNIIQDAIWNPKCTMCHVSGSSFAEQSGLILTDDVAYEELIDVTPNNIHAAEDGLKLVGTNGIGSLYNSFLWEKINAPNYEHFYEDHPEYGSVMPLGLDFLTNGELEFIRQWIIAGAPEEGVVASESLLLDETVFSPPAFEPLEIPENGIQIHLPPFNVPPQFERELFYYVEIDTPSYVYVNRIASTMRPGSHHFIVYTYDGLAQNNLPSNEVYRDIRNFDGTVNPGVLFQMQFQKFISGTQTRLFDYTFPEGVALKIDPSFGFDLNSHYANYSNDTIVGEVYNNFYFSDVAAVNHVAEILQLNNNDIYLPPNQETTISSKFWIEQEIGDPANIFQLFSHAHKLNTQFKVFRINQNEPDSRELIYISYDWEHPPVMKFDPPLFFNENEGIEMEATYFNDTDETVEFGLLSVDEMMIVFGLYFTGEQLKNDVQNTLPQSPLLHSNFPNPFNPNTLLRYDLPQSGMVNISIHDMTGRKIKTLVNSAQSAGYKTIQWNGTDDNNKSVSAGLYLYTIQTGNFTQTKKMVLLK